MLFSVITITYNAAGVIAPTLRSVAGQTFTDFEHLIQDGGSTDATLDLCRADATPGQSIVSGRDGGIYDAMNRAMARAKGDYLIFLNAGDAFPSADTLRRYADAIAAGGRPGIVYGQTTLVDADRREIGPRHLTAPQQLTLRSFARGMLVCHQAMAVKRSIAPEYDTRYRLSSDYDWVIRCLKRSSHNLYTGCVTALYLREGATTAHRRRSLTERFRIMCRHYGALPTICRHLGFALRALRRRSLS
ncbi:MAG: glycosyltransferase [Muribaculaceae bacterium]|nr:glycosyltransferase [Muribaculaceae bacterium]